VMPFSGSTSSVAQQHPDNQFLPPFPLRDPVILISILRSGSGMMSLKDLKEHHYTKESGTL
jgi:hypothetical protein